MLVNDTSSNRSPTQGMERGDYSDHYGDTRLCFTIEPADISHLVRWCVEQSLRHGIAILADFVAHDLEKAEAIRVEWVGRTSLECLEDLGLGHETETKILSWILAGQVTVKESIVASPLVESVRKILRPLAI